MSEYIEKLNDVQREAVVNYRFPSLIVAGAGSGKTRVLTCRIAYMLEQGVPPQSVLALTFTNKAAREMRERIGQLLSPAMTRELWMGTFHSIFARILRDESDRLGYPRSYTIYDSSDAKNMVKTAIRELNLSDETYKPGDIAARISLAKNNLITPSAYEANASLQAEDRERRRPQFLDIYKLYARKCRENGAMDFDDLLLNVNILFRDFPDALEKYQNQFGYILVDEYQDTNFAQYAIIRRLAQNHANVCVVGDDAQSIYSFRGAKIENILRFQNDFPDAKVFKLEQNYRSTQNIVNAANSIIEKNTKQIRKKSFSSGDQGEKIKVIKAYTDKEEASLIASDLYAAVRGGGVPYSETAVLYRTNAQSRALEEALRNRNIPYKIYGGVSFYQRKEIKDLLAYVRLVVNPKDDEAFRRIVNTPSRGIGDVTVGRIAAAAQAAGTSLWEAASTMTPESMELKGAAAKKIKEFAGMIADLSAMRATAEAYDLGLEIATRSGILGTYKMQQVPEAVSALENIEELLNSIRAYTDEQRQIAASEEGEGETGTSHMTIDEWLQNIALLTDMDNEKSEDRDRVTLMTVARRQRARVRARLRGRAGGGPVPEHDEPRHARGTRGGAQTVLRRADAGQAQRRAVVRRVALQVGKDGPPPPESLSERNRSEIPRPAIRPRRGRSERGRDAAEAGPDPLRRARTERRNAARRIRTAPRRLRAAAGRIRRRDPHVLSAQDAGAPDAPARTDAGRALPQHGQPSGRRNRRSGACGSRAVRRRLCRGDARRACQVRRRHGHGRRRVVGRPEDHRRVRRRGTQDAAAQVRQADGAEKISAARHFGTGGKREPGNEAEPSVSPPDAPRLPRQVRNKAGYHR